VTVRLDNVLTRDAAANPEADIAARSGHCDAAESNRFVRVFSLAAHAVGSDDENLHKRNSVAVLQEAIQQGLHPRGEVSFDGVVDRPESEPGHDCAVPGVAPDVLRRVRAGGYRSGERGHDHADQ
jgi:hypothetical protein